MNLDRRYTVTRFVDYIVEQINRIVGSSSHDNTGGKIYTLLRLLQPSDFVLIGNFCETYHRLCVTLELITIDDGSTSRVGSSCSGSSGSSS